VAGSGLEEELRIDVVPVVMLVGSRDDRWRLTLARSQRWKKRPVA
jgi:hypothetical protein